MNTEKEYRKIGKAIIDECMERGDERCITITLRSVQYDEKLYIRMEDRVEPMSIWKYSDLHAVSLANRQQSARERTDALAKKIRDAHVPGELPQVVIIIRPECLTDEARIKYKDEIQMQEEIKTGNERSIKD
jgi:hypothetical protein